MSDKEFPDFPNQVDNNVPIEKSFEKGFENIENNNIKPDLIENKIDEPVINEPVNNAPAPLENVKINQSNFLDKLQKFFKCWPVIIYSILNLLIPLIITIIYLFRKKYKQPFSEISLKKIFIFILQFILGYLILYLLCSNGFYQAAWLVLLLPLLCGFSMIFTFRVAINFDSLNNSE